MTNVVGWYRSERGIIHGDMKGKTNLIALWHTILSSVEYRSGKSAYYDGTKIKLNPGQMVTSQSELTDLSGLSRQAYRGAIKYLEHTGRITRKSTNKATIITVLKWDKYQNVNDDSSCAATKSATNEQPTSNQQATNTQPTPPGSLRELLNDSAPNKEQETINNKQSMSMSTRVDPNVEIIVNLYNEICTPALPRCTTISKKRKSQISARLRDNPDPEYWRGVFKALAASEFHTGNNQREWKATIDFIKQPDKHLPFGAEAVKETDRWANIDFTHKQPMDFIDE